MLFSISKERFIGYHAVFNDLGQSSKPLTRRQCLQPRNIDQDKSWLIKSADQIFSGRMVDAGFAADTGVHLRNQRRRNLNKGNASQIDRGGKPGQIATDASP